MLAAAVVLSRPLRAAARPRAGAPDPAGVLANRTVAATTLAAFFVMGAYTGLTVYLPIYLQLVHRLTPSLAGFALIPFMAGAVLGSLIVGRLMLHVKRYVLTAVLGIAAGATGLLGLALSAGDLSLTHIELLLLVIGTGLGANFPVTTVSVQNAVELRDLGAATGVLQFSRSLGSALGIAMLGAAAAHARIGVTIGARGAAATGPTLPALDGAIFAPIYALAALSAFAGMLCLALVESKPLRKR